jgi:hypothetical protein
MLDYQSTSDEYSYQFYLQMIEGLNRLESFEAVNRITVKNNILQKAIIKYEKNWHMIIRVLEEAHNLVTILQKIVERHDEKLL